MPTNLAIEIQGISKRYGSQTVLDGLTLQIGSGAFHVLVGKNGSGKSTLMRVLARQETFEGGAGRLLGLSFPADSPELLSRIGYASESVDFNLQEPLGAIASAIAPFFDRWNQAEFEICAKWLQVDLSKNYRNLSRGQRVRFQMCLLFARKPDLYLLDEITAVLDAEGRAFVMNRLDARVDEGATVVLVSNIVAEAQSYAESLALLRDGKVALNGQVATLGRDILKLKRPPGKDHELFRHPKALLAGRTHDGCDIYLLPRASLDPRGAPPEFIESSPVTAEEIFVFLTREVG